MERRQTQPPIHARPHIARTIQGMSYLIQACTACCKPGPVRRFILDPDHEQREHPLPAPRLCRECAVAEYSRPERARKMDPRGIFPQGNPPPGPAPNREEFLELMQRWRTDTRLLSNVETIINDPGAQAIRRMEWHALPWLLEALESDQPHHADALLALLTDQDPIPREHRGNRPRMRQAWLEWARERTPHPLCQPAPGRWAWTT